MADKEEVQDTSDYKVGKDGRKVKAHRIVFNKGEDDGKKGISEMKKSYKDFVEQHTAELTEEQKNEIVAELQEVLGKDAKAGDWISDFVHSDNPKFAGKSKEKRKQMALAAFYAKQRNEEVEQMNELSRDTLLSYANKVSLDSQKHSKDPTKRSGEKASRSVDGYAKAHNRLEKPVKEELKGGQVKLDKNKNGKLDVEDFKKLRKEDTEQIDEAIDANDYHSTSEKSQFGGHRPHVVNKKTGKTMMLGQHSYKSPEHAKAHAKAYLDAYASTGPNAAERAGHAYASTNKDKQMVRKEEIAEAQSHQSKTTMKHVSNPTAGEKKAAKDIKPGIAGYRDRIAMLKSAEARGALKKEDTTNESVFDWKNKGRQTSDSNKTKTYHDVKKISTGTVYTKQFDKDGVSKGTGGDAAAKAEGQPKRGRGRPKKDKFAEAVEFLLALSEEHFDDLMEEGFDAFIESYEQLDEMSKKALCSYTKKTK